MTCRRVGRGARSGSEGKRSRAVRASRRRARRRRPLHRTRRVRPQRPLPTQRARAAQEHRERLLEHEVVAQRLEEDLFRVGDLVGVVVVVLRWRGASASALGVKRRSGRKGRLDPAHMLAALVKLGLGIPRNVVQLDARPLLDLEREVGACWCDDLMRGAVTPSGVTSERQDQRKARPTHIGRVRLERVAHVESVHKDRGGGGDVLGRDAASRLRSASARLPFLTPLLPPPCRPALLTAPQTASRPPSPRPSAAPRACAGARSTVPADS